MALVDDIALRIPAQVLVELTNPDDNTATAQNSTNLAQAASSIQTYFETYAQEAYSSSVGIHVEVAVRGARDLMNEWGSGDRLGSAEFWDKFRFECFTVRDTRARARIVPDTNSELTPSDENPTSDELRPWADSTFFAPLHTNRAASDADDI